MSRVPHGGPSNINGINYQMLWALATLGSLQGRANQVDEKSLTSATLILEPANGGDQQQFRGAKRVVVQLKAKSGGGSWSLQEVIREVLPDLYLAVELDYKAEYHFVTEGTRGEWKEVEAFFASLSDTVPSDPLCRLDDTRPLEFGRRIRGAENGNNPSFWDKTSYTQRGLFEKIVESLRKSRAEIRNESIEVTRRKTWVLLAGFKLRPGYTQAGLKCQIDRWLLARIGSADELETCRNAMLQDLASRATRGDERVKPDEFFQHHKLDAKPLTEWFGISEVAKDHLLDELRRRHVELAEDVRPGLAENLYSKWTTDRPVLVLTGDGGVGKTWLGYCLLIRAASDEAVSLLVESPGDEHEALSVAAARFWNEIVGHDVAPPFANLRTRLQGLGESHKDREVCILFDGISDLDLARRLVLEPWDNWGVRVILTCPLELFPMLRSTLGESGTVVKVGDFSLEELHEYLEKSVGPSWPSIPPEVRNTLKRPLLARLYREIAGAAEWLPTREYDLYQRCWADLVNLRGVHALDLVPLMKAACSLLDGGTYPWSREQLVAVGMSSDSLDRLQRSGWVDSKDGRSFEVWHDRLLNWTLAEALTERLRTEPDTSPQIINDVCKLLVNPRSVRGRMLGFVPMDFLWLLIDESHPQTLAGVLRVAIDGMAHALAPARSELLFKELPTLGPSILPELVRRLEAKADNGSLLAVRTMSKAVAAVGGDHARVAARKLLNDDRPMLQRAGLLILRSCPDPTQLDRVWEIHSDSCADQGRYLYTGEQWWSLYEDTFDALRACAALTPSWIVGAVRHANPGTQPVQDLAYLLANVGEDSHWASAKEDLFAKVDCSHERSLATCILRFNDQSRVEWLEARVQPISDILGAVCLRALIRLDMDRAFRLLDRLGDVALYASRSWCFAEFLVRDRKRTLQFFHEKLIAHPSPWGLARVLQGQENLIEVRSLEFLLDELSRILESILSRGAEALADPSALPPYRFIFAVGNAQLLECLRRRRGKPLEIKLTNWLLARGPQQGNWLEHDKYDGLRVLALIGGMGLSVVLCKAMEEGDDQARLQAIEFAERCLDSDTEAHLVQLSQSDELWNGQAVIQSYAAKALAARGAWRPVVDYYVRWGLHALDIVNRFRDEHGTLTDEILAPALDAVLASGTLTPGTALAFGFAGWKSWSDAIRSALLQSQADPELPQACAIALTWLEDHDPSSVPALQRLLAPNRDVALNALLVNGSSEAFAALLTELRREFDHLLAAVLLDSGVATNETSSIVRDHLLHMSSPDRAAALTVLVMRLGPTLLDGCVDSPELTDFIRDAAFTPEIPFHIVGARAAAVRLLANRDPAAAFLAAEFALRDAEGPDREQWPYLLMELDEERSIPVLLNQAVIETKTRVHRSIGRSLANQAGSEAVRKWLIDTDTSKRRTACRLAGWMGPCRPLYDVVLVCLNDPDSQVASEAFAAVELLTGAEMARDLVEAFQRETDPAHQWAMLDGLVAIGDPGDIGRPRPWWAQALGPEFKLSMREYAVKNLREARNRAEQEADQKDR